MKRRLPYIIGIVALAAFAGFALASFRTNLTQYVPFEQALTSSRTVQIAGGLEAGSSAYSSADESLRFTLVEPEGNATMRVRYQGLKPANFEEAISIVAIGQYDSGSSEFVADKLLVKCPSKYQGAEVEEKTYG